MSDIVPLQVYPWPPTEAQVEVVRAAKATLNLDLKVLPTQAVPGLHGRVLALGQLPPWVCDAALVADPTDVDRVAGALSWLLTAPEGDSRGFMVKDYLEAAFGGKVVEHPPPRCKCAPLGCPSNIAYRNYSALRGRCEPCYTEGCYLTKGLCLRD